MNAPMKKGEREESPPPAPPLHRQTFSSTVIFAKKLSLFSLSSSKAPLSREKVKTPKKRKEKRTEFLQKKSSDNEPKLMIFIRRQLRGGEGRKGEGGAREGKGRRRRLKTTTTKKDAPFFFFAGGLIVLVASPQALPLFGGCSTLPVWVATLHARCSTLLVHEIALAARGYTATAKPWD